MTSQSKKLELRHPPRLKQQQAEGRQASTVEQQWQHPIFSKPWEHFRGKILHSVSITVALGGALAQVSARAHHVQGILIYLKSIGYRY